MITPKTQVSGSSNVAVKKQPSGRNHPPSPKTIPLEKVESVLDNVLCYYILDYGVDGISVLVEKKGDSYAVSFADWYGTSIDLVDSKSRLKDVCAHFLTKKLKTLLEVMNLIKLNTAMFFFAMDKDSEMVLTDIMLHPMKFVGPGMVRDLFGNVFKTQEVLNIAAFSKEAVISQGVQLILKPSKFRTTFVDGVEVPLYVRI
jgi:hypothetical protein